MKVNELQVAVDVGARTHRVAVGDGSGRLLEEFDLEHTAADFAGFFTRIERFDCTTDAVKDTLGMAMGFVFLSGLLLLALGACTTNTARRTNFDRCLANERSCDASLLTAGEQQRLFELKSQQHFQDCLAGLRCNAALLSGQEQRQVRMAVSQLNFQACFRGEAACRQEALTDEQFIEVQHVDKLRNFEACLGGLTRCDEAMLSETQLAAVRDAYAQRNFSGCMNTVGTLVGCNPDDLSAEQRDLVRRRNLAVNLFLCASAILGCDDSLLTPEQRARIAAGPPE